MKNVLFECFDYISEHMIASFENKAARIIQNDDSM